MAVNEREIVLDSLIEILEKNRFSHVIEKAVLDKYDYLDNKQKAFIKRMCEGTIENLIVIDGVIDSFSKVKVAKQKPVIRNILRLSVYQILYMDKVPDSAVCNEAVKLSGKRGFRSLSGFVNGVLRNISRNKDRIDIAGDAMPEWIKEHLINSYGQEKAALIIDDINKEHPVTIRIRDNKPVGENEGLNKVSEMDNVYTLSKGTSPADIEGYDNGRFTVQDIASIEAVMHAGISKGDTVLDVCAAPGGKSVLAYDLGAKVISRDISDYKVSLIDENINRCGISTDPSDERYIISQVHDATVFDESLAEKIDVLIADLPCSGLGVMGRKSDIKHKTNVEDLDTLPILQRQIIDTVVKYVKKGGVLMYSTCTMNPKENEEQAEYITSAYLFKIEYEKQFLPGIDGTDGFYIAKLRRI